METLLLNDAAYVAERYHAIEIERKRRQPPRGALPRAGVGHSCDMWTTNTSSRDGVLDRVFALDNIWPRSPSEKEAIVMEELLRELTSQIQRSLEQQEDDAATTGLPTLPTKSSDPPSTPPRQLQELPAPSQFGLKIFARVCASLRSTKADTTANARLLAMVAAKMPAMLATLPPMALAAGVVDSPCPATTEETVGETLSVLDELLGLLGPLLETTTLLTDAERANVLVAYVAVSLKWGRLRDLVEVLFLLITNPMILTPHYMKQLTPILSEVLQAEAIVPARPLLPEESSATGYLVSFGKGDHGKLGHGQCTHASCSDGNCTENKNVPTVIASTKEHSFVKVDSLSTHSIAITATGDVMAWGNGDKYRLGHGTTTKEYAPRVIEALSLKGKVADVACGLGHTLALLVNGDLYAWGNGSNGRLGLGDTNDRSNPTKLVIMLDGRARTSATAAPPTPPQSNGSTVFRHVICGASHSLAVTTDGRAFAWGKNNQGQCGHGHTNDQLTAIEIRHFGDELNERVVCAAGGWEHTLFCSTSGRVYSCGCGYKDSRRAGIPPVLGHGDCDKRLKPTVVQCFLDANEDMARVACGWDHSLAVSSQGALYTWGSGTNGKLGHGDEENCETPTLVRSLAGKVVKDAKAGCEHTVALTDTHELWTFGQGDSGRLGLGDTATRKVPTLVNFFTHSGLQPVAIAVGDKYNLILADDIVHHQGMMKSPGKKTPAHTPDHPPTVGSRRSHGPRPYVLETLRLRPLDQLLAPGDACHWTVADETESGCPRAVCPHDQGHLVKLVAVNLARLSTDYMTNLQTRGGTNVDMLPYGIDTAPLTLQRLLKVIRACQEGVTSERMLEVIIVCLRILTVNLSQWTRPRHIDSSLLEHVGATVDELAQKGTTSSQQVVDTDRAMELQSLIREEAVQVLQVGFTLFYPTTHARTRLLWDLFGGCDDSSFNQLTSPRAVVLASKLCEDAIAHDIILKQYVQSATHECRSVSSHEGDAPTNAASADDSKSFPRLLMKLLRVCAREANQRLEDPATDSNKALAIRLRLLTVLQSHWFAVSACSASVSNHNAHRSSICECAVNELSRYLCFAFDHAVTTLRKIQGVMFESGDAVIERLSLSFLDSVALQALQAASAFLSSLMTTSATETNACGGQTALTMAKALQPGARGMLEILDAISSKRSSSATQDPSTRLKDNWVDKLGTACALFCGQISSCFIGSLNNQQSGNTDDHPTKASAPGEHHRDAMANSRFRDGLSLTTELLGQLHSPIIKSVLLLKLSQTIQHHSTKTVARSLLEEFTLSQAAVDLCGQLTQAAAAAALSTRARVAALTIWLWVLHGSLVGPERLHQLVCESGIVLLAGQMLLCGALEAPADETPCREIDQRPASRQRSQPSLRLRPVEELIGALPPSRVLFLVAHEVFSAATKHLCSTFVTPPGSSHPFLSPIQTLPKTPVTLSTMETIRAVFDFLCRLLHGCLQRQEKRYGAISPLVCLPAAQNVSSPCSHPSTAFLLASPLSISTARSHIVKPLRVPRTASLSAMSATSTERTMRAISLWFLADNSPSSSAQTTSALVVLATIGEATDRLQESAASTASSTALELSTCDGLSAIVFVVSDKGKLRVGCSFSCRPEDTSDASPESVQPVWATWVVNDPIETGRWIHLCVSCSTTDLHTPIYVDGKRRSCQQPEKSQDVKGSFGKITPRAQLVTGGTLDDSLKKTTGVSPLLKDNVSPPLASPRQAPSSKLGVNVLIDDVWVFPDAIDDALAQRLFHQSQTLQQIKRDNDDDQKTLAVLQLLKQTLIVLPVREASADNNFESDTVAKRLQEDLFRLVCTFHSESSCEIALLAAETLQHIVPVATKPSRAVVETLLACYSSISSSRVLDLRAAVSTLYAFSARAGVQSAAVAASQVTVQGLLRQNHILTAPSATTITAFQHVLASSLVDLVQILSGLPAWQPYCTQVLDEAVCQMDNSTVSASSLPREAFAVVTMVAGYCEGFVNAQVVALGSANNVKALQAPWATTHRSMVMLTTESYRRAAWRFGCDFHSSVWNLRGHNETEACSSASLRDHDMAVLERIRLQTQVLRSHVGQGRTSSEGRQQLLSDPDAIAPLLRAAVMRSSQILKTRLGTNGKTAGKLNSVRLLKRLLTQARPQSPRLFIEDDLEVLAGELLAKLENQQRNIPLVVASIIPRHYWRDPRTIRSPLEPLSGDVEIHGLTVRALEHFPTVRFGRGVTITASSGLWYYEVQLLTDGLMQIGYVDTDFVADAVQGQGVGDHANSWAFDGYRRKKWSVSSSDYGACWRAGDVVGVLLDTDRLELSYFLNGAFLGVAFPSLPLSPTSLLFPAVSLNADQCVMFDFGERPSRGESATKTLRLPSLSSPLDAQRLRPVAAAIDDNPNGDEEDMDDVLDMDSDSDSENNEGQDKGPDGDAVYSPLETPTTPPSDAGFQIYHPAQADKDYLYQLPGSLADDDSELPVGVRSQRRPIQPGDCESKRDDPDDGSDRTRRAELTHGLVNLGFSLSWAERCAHETAFTLSDTEAITWILEQMESEAASSMHAMQHAKDSALHEISDELSTREASAPPRRAHDDLSLSVNPRAIGSDGRRSWQLALSPSRDGRPHSEQLSRSRASLSSPQKPVESKSGHHEATSPVDTYPFLLSELVSDEDDNDNDDAPESDVYAWNATAAYQFYRATASGSLRQRFARLNLSTSAEISTKAKDDTPRRTSSGDDQKEEDLLPACLMTHSILSLMYVRLLTESLLFGISSESDVAGVYPIVVQWATAEPPGLFEFLRMQLQLDAEEVSVSSSRIASPSDEHRIQAAFTRLLQFELETECKSASVSLVQSVVTEILARIADAIRDCKRAKATARRSEKSVLSYAMHARWTLWLVSTLCEALRKARSTSAAIIPNAANRPVLELLLEPALISDLTNLTAIATSANTAAWRNAGFSILQQLLLMDVLTQRLTDTTTLIPIQFLVELLARLVRKDQSRRLAFGAPIGTLWETVLAHLPPTPQEPLPLAEISAQPTKNEITLRVDQVASTYITISWDCDESPKQSEDDTIENAVLSLNVAPRCNEGTPSTLPSRVPHFLPTNGSLVLRQLAPDSIYTIRITKSTSPITAAEAVTSGKEDQATTTITQAVHVQTPRAPRFELDSDAAGKNLVLSNRNRTVTNQVNKKWHTVRASVGFDEGVHHWHVRIDTCVSKNIFIGVSTCDAGLDNYVGSDAFGYGFLANMAVWHNKTKLHVYGEIFKQGDLLQVSLDCHARTLSYSRNGESLGVAATNLHVATGTGSTGGSDATSSPGRVGCKWYPAFSLYNKDDQLTLIVPQSSDFSQQTSQHASVQMLVESARMLLVYADVGNPRASSLYENAQSKWRAWKQAQLCWREVDIGEIIEIDATRDAVAGTFGLAPGDSVFTSRGHCVVLGAHNHELWYELVDALDVSASRKLSSTLGRWSLSQCRDMISTPDEYPVHRARRYPGELDAVDQASPSHEGFALDTPAQDESLHLSSQAVQPWDALLVSLIDAIVVHRGLSSAYQLGHADLSSAIILHDVVDTLRLAPPIDESVLVPDVLLKRLLVLFYMNQHVYRVVRLFLTQSPASSWEHSVCWETPRGVEPSDLEKDRRERLVIAARLVANVGFPQHMIPSCAGANAAEMESRTFVQYLRSHLFETQREQLISESLRRTATATLVGTASDAKTSKLGGSGDGTLSCEPKDMLRLKIRIPSDGPASPFWQHQRVSSKLEPCWLLPPKEQRMATLFAQVSAQLYRVDPAECRRQFATPSGDSLPFYRSFQLGFLDPPLPGNNDAASETVVLADHASQYLAFWDDLFTEIQSPRFPLFIPTEKEELDLNAYVLLPEHAVQCGTTTDEAIAWFFTLGQLLGMVWRAHTIVPLQFVALAFWTDLLDDFIHLDTTDRVRSARSLALRTVREGLYCVVPFECLELSTPQSVRSRLSDTDLLQIDRLQHHAIYRPETPHHEAFWTVLRGFSSLERQACLRFLAGKTISSRWAALRNGDEDPMEHWKRQVIAASSTTRSEQTESPPLTLELVDALADAQGHPDACVPVVHVVHAHCTRLHLPAYSSASVLRHQLLLAITSASASTTS